jgi:squalene-associated FAD-dependent desaturase
MASTQPPPRPKNKEWVNTTVVIVGGGLAGLAAACALAETGFRVTLFERRPYLGGRASSYEHPGTGEVVDNCQHVLFGCCTNLIAFYKKIGIDDKIQWFDRMTFIEPGGRRSILEPSFLPAPLHVTPSFLGFKFLGTRDKLVLSRALMSLITGHPKDDGTSFQNWLERHGQTSACTERFWKPILVSALSEDLDRISIPYAAQVVRESMKSRNARTMGVPTVPLTKLYSAARDYIESRGGTVRFRSSVQSFTATTENIRLKLADSEEAFNYALLAVPFDSLSKLLPDCAESQRLREKLTHFETSPITGVHLWFDRQITDLPHAVLLDRTIQWMFHKSLLLKKVGELNSGPDGAALQETINKPLASGGTSDPAPKGRNPLGQGVSPGENRNGPESRRDGTPAPDPNTPSYLELVISSSKSLINKSRQEIIDLALNELREFFPQSRDANLIKATVIKEVNATFSPTPGIDQYRPTQITAWPRIFLAGDWTATGWPATMEGAVRSGCLAAESITAALGEKKTLVVPDLASQGLMRFLG